MKKHSKTIVGVDARPLSASMSGVARVISSILQNFPDTKNYHFILYSHRAPHQDFKKLLTLKHLSWSQGRGFLARTGGSWFNLSLPFSLRKDNLDLFWGSQQVLPPFLPENLPAVMTFYDLVLYFYPGSMRPLARLQQKLVQPYSVRRSSRILSISDQTRKDMILKFDYPSKQASVALLGYDNPIQIHKLNSYKKNIPELDNRNFILAVSTMEPRKNYSVLIDSYEKYFHTMPQALPLVIAGRRGWESPEFFAKLDKMKKKYPIFTVENASDEEIELLYRNCAFYVIPSKYEGFGLGLLEALAHKKYCIASDIGPFHEIGGESISYVPHYDVDGWAEEMRKTTQKFKKGTLKIPRLNIKKWTWKETAKKHYEAFEEVILL